jgi:hypothetical protein
VFAVTLITAIGSILVQDSDGRTGVDRREPQLQFSVVAWTGVSRDYRKGRSALAKACLGGCVLSA